MHASEPITITLADGQPRALRFTLAGVRRIRAMSTAAAAEADALDILPAMIHEGLVDKLSIAEIEELIVLPIDPALLAAITASIGGKPSENPPTPQP